MINLIYIKNPFDLSSRNEKVVDFIPETSASNYIKQIALFDEKIISVAINGEVVKDLSTIVNDGDYIIVSPKVEDDVFNLILSVALVYVAFGVGGWAATGNWGAAVSTWGAGATMGYLAAAAVMYIGGQLINPINTGSLSEWEQSTTYSWNTQGNLIQQGSPVPVTYGRVRISGQIISQHITSVGGEQDKQYLNVLLCGGEGAVDSISGIEINDTPISYYDDVAYETRLGVNEQAYISNFNDTYADLSLNYELKTKQQLKDDGLTDAQAELAQWHTHQTEGDAGKGLELTFECPQGLYYGNDSGGLDNATVEVQAQYKKEGESTWNYITTTTELTITANVNSAIRRTIRVDNIPAGRYDVRTRCTYKSGTTNRYGTRVYWTQLSHIIYDDFAYPNKVLVGIKALATSQLSGSRPTITWIQERKNVYVYDPSVGYVSKPATNPAWICYDMLHKARIIRNINTGAYVYEVRGIAKERFIYSEFKRWADFCDSENLTANMFFDVADGVWEQLVHIETLGRGKVVFRGTKLGTICDAPSSPVQLFTVANIYSDSFSEDFLSITSRANAVEVTFFNKDNNYKQEVVTVYNSGFDSADRLVNVSQVTLYGCVTRSDAIRHGRYMLRVSDNLIRTVSIEADVDAIACQVGDVVSVQHDVPQWGVGGRIVSYEAHTNATYTKKITLDKPVVFKAGKTYKLLSRFINANVEVFESVDVWNPSTVDDVETTIIYTKPFSYSMPNYNIFSFGEAGKTTKDFRVLDITRSKDMKRKISAIEYIPEVYDEDATIPDIGSYVDFPITLAPSNVKAEPMFVVQPNGTVLSGLTVSWSTPRDANPSSFMIYTSTDGGAMWKYADRGYGTSHTIFNLSLGTYSIGVVAMYSDGYSSQKTVINNISLTEKQIPPSDVRNFNATIENSTIIFTWDAVANPDLLEYHIRKGTSWIDSVLVATIPKGTTTYTYNVSSEGSIDFFIKAKDTSGNFSINEDYINFIVGDSIYPENVANFDVEQLI